MSAPLRLDGKSVSLYEALNRRQIFSRFLMNGVAPIAVSM